MPKKTGLLLILFLAISAAFLVYFFIISYLVDDYLMTYSDLGRSIKIMEFYQEKNPADQKVIYYWGASSVKESLDANVLDELIEAKNYNLGNPASSPIRRIIELDPALKSRPDVLVWGISYYNLSGNWLTPHDQYALVSPYVSKINLEHYDDEIKSLLTKDKLELLLYKRKFILSSLYKKTNLLLARITNKQPPLYYGQYNKDFKSEGILGQVSQDADPKYLIELAAKDDLAEYFVPQDLNNEMKAMELVITELAANNVSTILMAMPLHPQLFEKISPAAKRNFESFITSLKNKFDLTVLDYSTAFDQSSFYDGHHLNKKATKQFSEMVANDIKEAI